MAQHRERADRSFGANCIAPEIAIAGCTVSCLYWSLPASGAKTQLLPMFVQFAALDGVHNMSSHPHIHCVVITSKLCGVYAPLMHIVIVSRQINQLHSAVPSCRATVLGARPQATVLGAQPAGYRPRGSTAGDHVVGSTMEQRPPRSVTAQLVWW